jgi:hypothetical protein
MIITIEEIQAAINAGYPVDIIINGEYYELKEGDNK